MHPPNLLFALVLVAALGVRAAFAQPALGAQGAEGEPHRLQQWLVPAPDPVTAAHAVLFRPPGEGPFPLAVIAHASTQNVMRRAQMPQPEYRALAAWLVTRGFAVLVPERPGHGATSGKYLEDQGGCDEADYAKSGRVTADEIAAAIGLLRKQSFIRPEAVVVIGHSAGAWGALALAGEELGLVGTVTIMVLFAILVLKGFQIAGRARGPFGRYLALGIALLIGVQVLLNAGVVTGLLPTKGLTLPLVSYGGSSLVTSLLGIGILLSISRDRRGGRQTIGCGDGIRVP